jgi:type II secretory pathway pseudopilin PulG
MKTKNASIHPPRRLSGYTLLEIIIVLGILAVAMVGVLRFFQTDSAKAAVQQEQTNLAALVRSVNGAWASKSSFAGISADEVAQLRSSRVRRDATGKNLLSSFGSTIDIRPATVNKANDAYQIVYSGLNTAQCAGLVPAVAGEAYAISINNGESVVSSAAATRGKVVNPAAVAQSCAQDPFAQSAGVVTLTYHRNAPSAGALVPGAGCTTSCAPQTEAQTIACPMGQSGQVNQTRSGSCSASACPSLVWSPWVTTSSSCAVSPPTSPPPTVTPPVPVTPPTPTCTVATYTRTQGCPSGYVGIITQEQKTTCPSGTLTPWTTVSNTCVVQSAPLCASGTNTNITACPVGQFGQITQMRNYSCDADGNKVNDGPWVTVSNNCTTTGTCRPSTRPNGQRNVACAPGQFGRIIQDLQQSSTCPTATALPIWGPDVVVGSTGSCAACPATVVETGHPPCPTGQVGSITQTRSKSYACAGAPTTLPPPTYSPWTTTVNTCVNPVPGPVTNFELGFWGGYWWQWIKTGSFGTCNAPVDGRNPDGGGSTGYNTWILFNTEDASADLTDHYVITMTRKGVTKSVTIPATRMHKNASPSEPDKNGRQYWYQGAGIANVDTVNALTPDIDWSKIAYASATKNGTGGIKIEAEFCAATVSIKACNAAGQCSASTTQTNGISVWSEGERDCQAKETGSVPALPPSARQCTAGLPPRNGCGDPCSVHGGTAGWFTGRWMKPGVPECVMALPYCEP